jgi:hypothetical protein
VTVDNGGRQLTVRELMAFLETCPGGALVFAEGRCVDGISLNGDPPAVQLEVTLRCVLGRPDCGASTLQ